MLWLNLLILNLLLRLHMCLRLSDVGIRHLTWNLRRACLKTRGSPATNLGIGITGCLSLCRGVRFGNLSLLAASGGLGNGGGLGPACGFHAFGSGGAGCIFGLAQRTPRRGVRLVRPLIACGIDSLALGCVRCCSGLFGLSLSQKRLFANLLCGAMSQLCPILPTRCGKVPILRAVQIGPGVENSHIFRRLCCWQIIDPVCAMRIHKSLPVPLIKGVEFL
jgi:hypothetical protein